MDPLELMGGGVNKEERFMKPFTSIQCLKFFLTDGNA